MGGVKVNSIALLVVVLIVVVVVVRPPPSEEFSCWSALDRRPTDALERAHVLQAWMPSYHVWPSSTFPALPQFPNQEPLRPQQLVFSDFPTMPHFGHKELTGVVIAADVHMRSLVKMQT